MPDETRIEPAITINGLVLSVGQAMTIRCAIESFASDLRENSLGDDDHGKRMTAGYLARITEIRAMYLK